MSRYWNGASAIAIASIFTATPALAQDAPASEKRLQTVTITATKRAESAQDVPIAVNAIGSEELQELDISVFSDYLTQLPGVTAGGGGPGQNTIYIRGVASTTPNLTTAGVAGLAPNVAFYLDEQPLAQPGRNLDVYAADMERIEVLSGPQGTLFGASSQAGTVRLITNKPNFDGVSGTVNFATSFTEGGEMSNKVKGIVNVPVTDKFAVRGVVYNDRQGGYIDNVAGTIDASESARFRPEGTVRSNGVPVSALRAGFQSTADLSGVTFLEANNAGIARENFNDTTYAGFRVSGLYEFNNDWSLLVGVAQQQLDSEGVFFSDPDLDDDWEIQRYEDDDLEDKFTNVSWTVDGQIGALEAVYTGAFTDRDTDQRVDYTDYLFVGQYLPYYICDYDVTYPAGAPTGTCQAPNLYVNSSTETEVLTQELRFNTPAEYRIRGTFGAFYSNLELAERNDFTYPGSIYALDGNGLPGFAPNYPLTNTSVTGQIGNAFPGYYSDPGPFPAGVIFRNDVLRTDEQLGAFGEASFDIVPDMLTLTVGARWYDIEVDLEGSANSSFFNFYAVNDTDAQAFGTNISRQFSGEIDGIPDTAATDGVITKVTLDYKPTTDMLFYATYSEGFRPGLLNRPGGAAGPDGYTVPYAVDTDDVTNYEIGWKTFLLDGNLRFNGSAFFVDVQNLQTTIFDPSIVNLFFSDNAANAEIFGVEGDFAWGVTDGLTIAGAFSYLDTEVTEVLVPTNDVTEGSSLAFAPEFQGNLRARYEWQLGDYTAHVMPQLVYSDESYTDIIDINRMKLDSWMTLALSAGLTKDNWRVELFGQNLTNEAAQMSGNYVNDRDRVSLARPRTIGVRVGMDF